jgi:hypothetical protein
MKAMGMYNVDSACLNSVLDISVPTIGISSVKLLLWLEKFLFLSRFYKTKDSSSIYVRVKRRLKEAVVRKQGYEGV